MEAIIAMIPVWVKALTVLVTGATAVTALTTSKADNKIVDVLLKILNMLAGNVIKNKNADSTK